VDGVIVREVEESERDKSMKRSEVNKVKKQNNWRQGREEAHCDICTSISSYKYSAGFGTRIQKKCSALGINTEGIKVCDKFECGHGVQVVE
jgi:hypothetical protein